MELSFLPDPIPWTLSSVICQRSMRQKARVGDGFASDGSCGRIASMFVSFSRLHESEQFRFVVDIVSVLVSTASTL